MSARNQVIASLKPAAGGGGGGIVHDANSGSPLANGASATLSHTCTGTGTNGYLFVGVSFYADSSKTVTGITYNGVAMTFLGSAGGANERVELWGLKVPATGANNIVVSFSAGVGGIYVGAASFTGVHQTTPTGTFAGASGVSAEASVTVSSASGEVVVDALGAWDQGGGFTVGAGQTQQWNGVQSEVRGAGSREAGAASVTMTWTIGSTDWNIGGISLKPA